MNNYWNLKKYIVVSKYHHADEITVLLALFVPYLSLSCTDTYISHHHLGTSWVPEAPREGMYILIAHLCI